uniref:Uncharacterized protein n=1 Tax=Lactuca sativa TaxID=4236 RepID=A0A9R1VI80_LACSA|nr:hypothetical protein LSAT_V11C500255710 [Lactuca sativa]
MWFLEFNNRICDDYLINNFLESCPLLEDLSLTCCFINELDLLCISCPKLKKMTIESDEYLLLGYNSWIPRVRNKNNKNKSIMIDH